MIEWVHRRITWLVVKGLEVRYGEEAADHYFWSMTCLPAGLPFPSQLMRGIKGLLFGRVYFWHQAKLSSEEFDRDWKRIRQLQAVEDFRESFVPILPEQKVDVR